jgi:hypothetical protein
MAPDPGWSLIGTRYAGLVPEGRTYILPLDIAQTDPSVGLDRKDSAQVHATILNGAAYFFVDCGE